MIRSFKGQLAEDFFFDRHTGVTKRFPSELRYIAQHKLQYLNSADSLNDLRAPPGNRLESLRGDLKGFYSIRINSQWRIIFRWDNGPREVRIADYH